MLDQFKEWISANDITHNPWHNDVFFLRFCRARKFNSDDIIVMFSNYMAYRNDNDIDNIITVRLIIHFIRLLFTYFFLQ